MVLTGMKVITLDICKLYNSSKCCHCVVTYVEKPKSELYKLQKFLIVGNPVRDRPNLKILCNTVLKDVKSI